MWKNHISVPRIAGGFDVGISPFRFNKNVISFAFPYSDPTSQEPGDKSSSALIPVEFIILKNPLVQLAWETYISSSLYLSPVLKCLRPNTQVSETQVHLNNF